MLLNIKTKFYSVLKVDELDNRRCDLAQIKCGTNADNPVNLSKTDPFCTFALSLLTFVSFVICALWLQAPWGKLQKTKLTPSPLLKSILPSPTNWAIATKKGRGIWSQLLDHRLNMHGRRLNLHDRRLNLLDHRLNLLDHRFVSAWLSLCYLKIKTLWAPNFVSIIWLASVNGKSIVSQRLCPHWPLSYWELSIDYGSKDHSLIMVVP